MESLGLVRKRIGFFGVCNLFDRVEMKQAETEAISLIQNRHTLRFQQMEKTMETMDKQMDKMAKTIS